jgi:hypothetical protein
MIFEPRWDAVEEETLGESRKELSHCRDRARH